jgi:hypothetical protein
LVAKLGFTISDSFVQIKVSAASSSYPFTSFPLQLVATARLGSQSQGQKHFFSFFQPVLSFRYQPIYACLQIH